MDFQVKIGDEVYVFELFYDTVDFIQGKIAHWNNLASDKPLAITLEKIKGQTETLDVAVSDELNLTEMLR